MTADEVLAAQFKEFLAQQGLENGLIKPNEPPKPQPIELEIGGQKLTFDTPQDLQNALERQLSQNANTIATLEAAVKAPQQQAPATPASNYEDQKIAFYEKFKDDPFEAIEMALGQRIFDGKVQNPAAVLRDAAIGSENSRQLLEIARFKDANPTFNPQTDAATLDNIRAGLGLPITAAGLDAAYAAGLKNGIFRVPQQQNNQQQNFQAPPTPGRFQPQQPYSEAPPSFDPITAQTIEDMPLDKLEAFLRTQGAF